ncbi:MAG TPA: RHS repeat-associated core domain-containing protein [Candidatus Paceibacterota bacterium]|nr:RHS repeat-associated core domain-containing protein [Candidatus Paceibacterota bacterium]
MFEHNDLAGLYLQAGYGAFAFEENRFLHNTRGVQVGLNASFLDDDATEYADNGADVYLDGGTITAAEVEWSLKPAYAMLVGSQVTVGSEARLRILPGTVVKFAQYQGLVVDGALTAIGTAMAPITFTDWRDDTAGGDSNGDGDETVPAPDWWRGIVVRNAGSAVIDQGRVRYAGYWDYAGLVKSGTGDLTLRRTTIQRTYGSGLHLNGSVGEHLLERNNLAENRVGILAQNQAATVVLTANLVEGNRDFGVRNQNSVDVDARGNWWGHETGPRHAALNPEGQGDTVSDGVLFEPWRTTPSAGEIRSPVRSGTLVVGDLLRFSGSVLTEPGATSLWRLSDGRSYAVRDPGLLHFPDTGSATVAYSLSADGTEDPHPDTRVYSVVPNSGHLPDLRVTQVRVSGTLAVGQPARIEYAVRNVGQGPAEDGWRDAVYLSRDSYLDIDDVYLGSAVVDRVLPAEQSFQGTIHVTLPAVEEGAYHLILVVNDEWGVLEVHRLNNEFATQVTAEVPALVHGLAQVVQYDAGRVEHYFRMTATAGKSLLLDLAGVPDDLEVFVRFGALATRGVYDHHLRGGEQLLIPAAAPGNWHVMVYGEMDQAGEYSLRFSLEDLVLSGSSPSRHGDSTDLELTLTGAGFIRPLSVELVSGLGQTYGAGEVEVDSFTQATATFAAATVPPGLYAARVSHGAAFAVLPNALEITAGGIGNLAVKLILPPQFGYHILATVFVEYANTGEVPIPAPLLHVTATQRGRTAAILTLDQSRLSSGFWTSAMPEGFANSVQFIASGDTPGILQPGESRRMPVYYAGWQKPWDFSYPPFEWQVGVLDANNATPIDWAALKNVMRPDYVREDAWAAVWSNFTALTGPTWGHYVAMLSRNALYLHRHGQRVEDLSTLQAFTFRQAEGFSPIAELAGGVDALVPAPGLPIVFKRSYLQQISRRFELGPLGRGWTHNWQVKLRAEADHTVFITDETGTPRIFQPDSRYTGRYLAQPGDQGELRAAGGGYRLTEVDGMVLFFGGAGELVYLEDTNGNRITCTHTDHRLTALTHSAGPALTLAYNAEGRLASVTDPHGRQTRFTYAGEHLTSVQDYDGRTTAYSYRTASGPSQHALSAIQFPNGGTRTFTYDERGRLSGIARADQNERFTFAQAGIGRVDMTDPLGNASGFFFDHWGRLFKTENPLGEVVQMSFDGLGNLVAVEDPDGFRTAFVYDRKGNVIEAIDAMRRGTRFSYTRAFNRLAAVTDALSRRTEFQHDSRGNLQTKTHPDGQKEIWTSDTQGQATSWTNRRGMTVAFQYDTAGRITRKRFADGSESVYRHDSRGNLIEAQDGRGITVFTYNTHDDLMRVAYPGNRWIEFAYDPFGRRASSLDQLGYRVEYHYDESGRLSGLSDHTGDMVTYAYDALGRLGLKTMGNGVSTTYTYDPAGRLLELVNRTPDQTVLSRFAYTYDRRGRRTASQTHYGVWTYQYDDVGQLTRAVLQSTDPDIPSQNLVYEYDAVGNRIRTQVNGPDEDYVVNDLNQYLRVGNRICTYDLDGNLIREDGPGGSSIYTYNDENRLIGVARGGDTWTYTYDALGNRVAVDKNGAVTHYVHDPMGLADLAAEYDDLGRLVARHVHGLGLVSRTPAGRQPDYYTYDPMGNTSELSGPSGILRNAYAYRPFGEAISAHQTVANPFHFMGEVGIMADSAGWQYVRARHYDARAGRFTAMDPVGFFGGDHNLYRYAMNSPVHMFDPSGFAKACATHRAMADMALGAASVVGGACLAVSGAAAGAVGGPAGSAGGGAPGLMLMGYGVLNMWWGGGTLLSGSDELPLFSDVPKWLIRQNAPRWSVRFLEGTYEVVSVLRISNLLDGAIYAAEKASGYVCSYNQQPVWAPLACSFPGKAAVRLAPQGLGLHGQPPGASPCMPFVPLVYGDAGLAASHDPNEKIAVGGHGERNFLQVGTLVRYQIDFENMESATAPAQIVTIRDPLSPDLDLTTFEIAEIGFGEIIIPVGQGRRYFEETIAYAYTDNAYSFVVDVQIEVWIEDRMLHANFLTLDPATGLPPQNVGVGFLPPENETGRGMGYVAYVARPQNGLPSGAAIRNVATIQFDFGLDIDTNQIDPLDKTKGTDPAKEALVTIDAVPPSSRVHDLPAESPARFAVSWSGTDDASGVRGYDVYVSRADSAYQPWLLGTGLTSAVFDGESGQTYRFYCVAVDNAGNREGKTPAAEALTTVSAFSPPRLIVLGWGADGFTLQIQTDSNRAYTLECSDQIEGADWIELDQVWGNGATRILTDRSPAPITRFYRVRVVP